MGTVKATTSHLTNVFVKGDFAEQHKHLFNCFDADEKYEILEEWFRERIDFPNFIKNGVVDAHFPLHTRNTIEQI